MTETDTAFVPVKENAAREAAREMVVSQTGLVLTNWTQTVDLAKYMATSGFAVRKELRENIGACIAIVELATGWGFKPFQLARVCYVVNDILCFESQVLHAVVEKFAPLKERLRPTYVGEGAKLRCIIKGHFKGELEPLEYKSPEIGTIDPKRSPLWKTDPEQQLFYFSTARWAKRYCPDILLGVHDIDQIEPAHVGFDHAKDVTPKLAERLGEGLGGEGFAGLADIDAQLAQASA